MTADDLASISLVLVYSALAVYVLAFIAAVLGLSARSRTAEQADDLALAERPAQAVLNPAASAAASGASSGSAGRGTAVLERLAAPQPTAVARFDRMSTALVAIAFALHVAALVTRGLAAGRVPWGNMYEFALTGTGIIVGVYLAAQFWRDLRFLAAYATGIVAILLGLATVNFYVAVAPLPPALQSAWLVIHVFVATLGTGFFALGGGLSIAQLLQTRHEAGGLPRARFLAALPSSETLELLASRVIIVGFAFWTFTLMAGAIWANAAWGRYWGWDTKEVWTFIIWVVYAGYIHARATRGWRGTRSAWLALVGFSAVLFNFTVVNLLFKGLHSYSGL
ncbi:MAG: c-type cytochrome biogenesis protein CcsB [Actinomycetales bacterium]|nr:c-type cytochrome biogenesis protein CcsB [Actinomycetales bacterium]